MRSTTESIGGVHRDALPVLARAGVGPGRGPLATPMGIIAVAQPALPVSKGRKKGVQDTSSNPSLGPRRQDQ